MATDSTSFKRCEFSFVFIVDSLEVVMEDCRVDQKIFLSVYLCVPVLVFEHAQLNLDSKYLS